MSFYSKSKTDQELLENVINNNLYTPIKSASTKENERIIERINKINKVQDYEYFFPLHLLLNTYEEIPELKINYYSTINYYNYKK